MIDSIPTTIALDRRPARRCDGFLYVAVLFTTLLVMVSVSAALSISTSKLRGETDRNSRAAALRQAESELHRQAAMMLTGWPWRGATNNDFSPWSSHTVDGVPVTSHAESRVRFYDVDGDLADDPTDSVELTVHARIGRSEAAITAELEPDPVPLDLLRYAVTAANDLRFESGGTLACERPVQVGGSCRTYSWGAITAPRLECSNDVQMTLRGDLASAAVSLPSQDVVAHYVSRGTEIPHASLPQTSSVILIQDQVFSPTLNPLGEPDDGGIYWFDAQGMYVVISHCRLDATLAIENAATVRIQGGVVWHYPTTADVILATDSPVLLLNIESTLDEAARAVNFNPPAAAYRQTSANDTATDVYPTELRGVVYTTSDFRMNPLVGGGVLPLSGAVIGSEIRIDGRLAIHHLDELLADPPASLSDPTPMRLVRGSIRRIPSP